MIIKMSTAEIIETYYAVEEFIKKDISLPARVAWDLEDNQDALKKIVDKFEKERDKNFSDLREKDAFFNTEEGRVAVKEEFRKEFQDANDRVEEFVMLEHEIDIATVSRSSLPETLTNKDIRAIKFMVTKDEPKNETEE